MTASTNIQFVIQKNLFFLKFLNFSQTDYGEYKVEIKNSAGMVESVTKLEAKAAKGGNL